MVIGDYYKDSEGNSFVITEQHSGFVWLRNQNGDLKQIGKDELKFYTKLEASNKLKVYHYNDTSLSIYGSVVAKNLKDAEKIAKESLEYNYRTNKLKQDKKSKNPFVEYNLPEKEGIFMLW